MKIAAFYENIVTACEQTGESLESTLACLKAHGLQMIYISGTSLREGEAELLPLFARLDLPVEGLHQHFDFGHHPEDESWRDYMDLAVRCGARNFLVVPGMVPAAEEEKREELVENMLSVVRRMVEYGREAGMPVCMEDFDSLISPFNGIDGLGRFLREAPGLMCAFDTGNFVCHGEDPMAAFDLFADKIITVHVKDRCPFPWVPGSEGCLCADGSVAYVAPVGSGTMPIAAVIRKLRDSGYSGNLIAELFSCGDMKQNLIRSLEYLSAQV